MTFVPTKRTKLDHLTYNLYVGEPIRDYSMERWVGRCIAVCADWRAAFAARNLLVPKGEVYQIIGPGLEVGGWA